MGMNPIQFQPGLPMLKFIKQHSTEAKCCLARYRARWPREF
jgi:hypothetical protein